MCNSFIMGLLLAALVGLSAVSPISDGDAIVALAWDRRRINRPSSVACIAENTPSTADLIRDRPYSVWRSVVAIDNPQPTPDQQRLQRIAKGEGRTPAIDLTRLALPAPSPDCKEQYSVSAPAIIGDHAYMHIDSNCGLLCGGGEILALERRDGTWQVTAQLMLWAY